MLDEIEAVAARACEEAGLELDAERGFDASIGHEEGLTPSHWQLIAPMRGWPHGTRKLNAVIQDRFHAWAKRSTASWYGVKFGDKQVTWHDKVIQIRNEQVWAYSHELKEREPLAVFNGQIGGVVWSWPRPMKTVGPTRRAAHRNVARRLRGPARMGIRIREERPLQRPEQP